MDAPSGTHHSMYYTWIHWHPCAHSSPELDNLMWVFLDHKKYSSFPVRCLFSSVHSHQQQVEVPVAQSLANSKLSGFSAFANLAGVPWYLISHSSVNLSFYGAKWGWSPFTGVWFIWTSVVNWNLFESSAHFLKLLVLFFSSFSSYLLVPGNVGYMCIPSLLQIS